ncbi:hypothetical protein [Cerasicoccus frondis]|uniref:hypothetical protein n=1 Tax=Cerasicoccus frondis TaxID=490090 RepID=UPI0028527DDB|nr:hypothetical protein [Cerasicoccus frondis]
MAEDNENPDETPTPEEQRKMQLEMITLMGRIRREMATSGKSMEEVAQQFLQKESRQEYLDRNEDAVEQATQLMDNPEYMALFEKMLATTDPEEKEALGNKMREMAYYNVDIEALHRKVNANNRRLVAEGLLPPEALINPKKRE